MTITINGTTGISGVDGSSGTPAYQGNDANTGISFGTDIVTINTGGTARVTTNASGNLGIGTISPNQRLQVTGSNSTGFAGATLQNSNANVGLAGVQFSSDTTYSKSAIAQVRENPNGAGPLVFYVDSATDAADWASGDEKMRISAAGNVGIGTISPQAKLSVSNGGAAGLEFFTNYPGGGVGTYIQSYNRSGSAYVNTAYYANSHTFWANGDAMVIASTGNVGIGTATTTYRTNIVYTNSAGGVAETGLYLRNTSTGNSTQMQFDGHRNWSLFVNGSFGAPAGGFTIQDNTAGVARLSIDSSGNLLVGTTTPSWVNSNGFVVNPSAGEIYITHSTAKIDGDRYAWFVYNTTHIGSIAQSGTTGVAYVTTSDYRLKENVAPMTGALAKVAALKPVTYTWKVDGSDGQGFIAHELQAVVPDCVTGVKDAVDKDGKPQYQGVDTSFLVATLVSAIQELTARLEALENK